MQTRIETSGEAVHRLTTLLGCITDEYRVSFDEFGLTTSAVDPANVAMVDLAINATSEIDVIAETDGTALTLGEFESGIAYARKGRGNDRGDTVTITHYDRNDRLEVVTDRKDGAKRTYSWYPPSADAIRATPDIPEIDYEWDVRVDAEELRDVIAAAKTVDDHVQVGVEPAEGLADGVGDFYVFNHLEDGDDTGRIDSEFRFEGAATWDLDDEGADPSASTALYSLDYLEEITTALARADIGKVNFRFCTEFPCEIGFEDPKYGYTGRYVLAPRKSSDGSPYDQPEWDREAYTLPDEEELLEV